MCFVSACPTDCASIPMHWKIDSSEGAPFFPRCMSPSLMLVRIESRYGAMADLTCIATSPIALKEVVRSRLFCSWPRRYSIVLWR